MSFRDALVLTFIWMILSFATLFAVHFTKVMISGLIGTSIIDGKKVETTFMSRILIMASAVLALAVTIWLVQTPIYVALDILRSIRVQS